MKRIIIFIFLLLFSVTLPAQMLLENKEGDAQFVPLISTTDSTITNRGLIKINTGDQSIGFDYFQFLNNSDRNKYKFWSLGLKSKPTEGYATVIKNNQFTPGFTLNSSITQMKIFDKEATKPENNFIDWGSIYFNVSANKYQLLKTDTTFENQLSTKLFKGFSIGINYNVLLKSTYLISLKIGYARKNNYTDLNEFEIKEIHSYLDSTSNITRQISSTKTARQGIYSEFDSYPISLSLTKLTSDDPKIKDYSFGYNLYLSTQVKRNEKVITKAGCILFLAKNKDGISTPILGLNIQFDDFFDVKGINNGLLNRISLGLTSSLSF